MFFLLYKTYWWQRFWWFSEDFRPLSEDFRRFSKILPKARRTFPNIFRKFPKISDDIRRCPKITEDFRWRPEDVSMIHQRISVQFKRQTWYHRSHRYLHMWRYHIFTSEDIISLLSICYHSLYHWLLYNKFSYFWYDKILLKNYIVK